MFKGIAGEIHDLCEHSNDLMFSVTPEGRFHYVNQKWLDALGYSREELKKLTIFDVVHPSEYRDFQAIFIGVMCGYDLGTVSTTFISRNYLSIKVEGTISCVFQGNKPIYTRAVLRDISEKTKLESERDTLLTALELKTQRINELCKELACNVTYEGIVEEASASENDMAVR